MSIKVGDVVELNSGSHYMTVTKILNNGEAVCIWFVDGDVKTYSIAIQALKPKS